MWVASFLRLILASRYQVGVWPTELFVRVWSPRSETRAPGSEPGAQDLSQEVQIWRFGEVQILQPCNPFKSKFRVKITPKRRFLGNRRKRQKKTYFDVFCEKVDFCPDFRDFWPPQDLPGISQKNSIVFVFFYCSPTAKRRPKTPPKRTIPHQMIHFWFSGFPGKSKCRVKNDVFVGIRTSKSKNRSPVWPVIWKVFCRIKWSIISGPLDPGQTPGSGKSRQNRFLRQKSLFRAKVDIS